MDTMDPRAQIAGAAQVAKKEPPAVSRQLQALNNSIVELSEAIAALRIRLAPVMLTIPDKTIGHPEDTPVAECPLSGELTGFSIRVSTYNTEIRELLDHLEI